ncbi:acetyl-CoA C-acetyltransferase [Streptacidiphilus sp. ASG 303]|uniref:acetyl-CoA C-acetyltransferase n=1 Tax=Streptacidiphilus sp. ASG 303 TaxID=2896847 RepID=UPI001E2C92D7|nr:acetyl-CoA C-acetyltransferase [Streptacidiphilus sp. ASG 303]MCD0485431.1 acetyl-CoA C-acetyltransferase [Streptacidiphilus sp. ASG 303]
MPEAVIVAARRSPIGRAGKGALADVRPDDLLAHVIGETAGTIGLTGEHVDDVIVGCGLPGGEQGFNIARVATLLLGWTTTPGTTVNRFCASSLQAIRTAVHAVRSGEGDCFVAAGVETVSRYVHGSADAFRPATDNPRFGPAKARTARLKAEGGTWTPDTEGLPDAYIDMGDTAENVADLCSVSRRTMDEFALQSHQRALAARDSGFWAEEIVPVTTPSGAVVDTDDGPRPDTTLEKLAALPPRFREDGRVTAGNSCPLNDGAAAVVVMSAERAAALGLTPLARVVASAVSALNPEVMGLGPVEACRRAMKTAGLTAADIDLLEINEAFAAQVVPSADQLGIGWDRLNVNGGGIALGHPFGMTGARIMTTLVHSLQQRDRTFGMESMCVGGGQGMAMIVERLS